MYSHRSSLMLLGEVGAQHSSTAQNSTVQIRQRTHGEATPTCSILYEAWVSSRREIIDRTYDSYAILISLNPGEWH